LLPLIACNNYSITYNLPNTYSMYCIAIIPPEPAFSKIQFLNRALLAQYKKKGQENFIPFIPLLAPFKWDSKNEYLIIDALKKFAVNHFSVEAEIHGLDQQAACVQLNLIDKKGIQELQKQLKLFLDLNLKIEYNEAELSNYSPSLKLELTYKSKQNAKKVWENFQHGAFSLHFIANNFSLLRYETDTWTNIANFHLE
jgi:hypothetical protein